MKGKRKGLHLWIVKLNGGTVLNILTDCKTLYAVQGKVKPLISSRGEFYDQEINNVDYAGTIDA